MKKNEMQFYQFLRDFLLDYLVIRRSFSDKTVRTYKQSLKQFRIYLQEQKGISFDSMSFSCFTRKQIYDFLMHLRDSKGCSVATINLRLSAIKAFLRFCSEEDLQFTSVYLDVSSIHAFKGSKKASVEYLTSEQLKILFVIPDVSSKIDRRDRFIMIFLYETGARIQELLDLTIGSIIRSGKTAKVRIYGKGAKIRYVPLMQQQ